MTAKRNRVLVLGGAGFIGSHLVRAFLKRDWRVGVIDGIVTGTGGTPRNLEDCQDDLEFALFQKIEEAKGLSERVVWADWIVDTMAFTGHLLGFQDPLLDTSSNLLSHLHLIDALKTCPGKRLIYLGSRSQYGAVPSDIVTEESPCQPLDPQGINKLAAEQFLRIYGRSYHFRTVSLRLTNCFGPQQRVNGERGLVGSFIHSALNGEPIEIFGRADRRKNVLFVDDAARVVVELTKRDWDGFQIFNMGGADVALQALLEAIFQAAGMGSFTVKPFPDEIKKIDVGEAAFSDEKLTRFMGHHTRADLGDAIRRTVEYFKENQGVERP